MEKIKFMVDSSSDISDADLQEHGIEMLSIPITIDGKGYLERRSFTTEEYYNILETSKTSPTTSGVPAAAYLESYTRIYEEGYTDIVNATISSIGSGTYQSAVRAKDEFYDANPDAKDKFNIHVVDSRCYTCACGYPMVQSAKMAAQGKSVADVLTYLDDWFATVEVYFGVFTLAYAKKSGRISGASAFVGEVLGLRPIIRLAGEKADIMDKVRGDKKVVPRLFEAYKKSCTDPNKPVFVIGGLDDGPPDELAAMIEKDLGRSVIRQKVGACITTHTGPRPVALVFHGRDRRKNK
ncbi:MAG: DegV family protein [Oscillospiraceae bacterium]|nr:DegV family protein [Oscillospiraceae bacterium]